jgi:hypothetical protein
MWSVAARFEEQQISVAEGRQAFRPGLAGGRAGWRDRERKGENTPASIQPAR